MKRRLLCLCLALLLTAQLVLPAAAETAAAETTESAVTETTVPEETTAPTEETTAPTEETTAPTEETTAPTEETTAPTEETEASTEQTEEDEEDDSAAPLADAEGTEIADASQTCGENLTWTLENGTLTISGTGAMTDYDRSNKAPWQGQTIQSLILNEGITSIGAHAFEFVNLQNQGTLQLPSSLQSIGEYAFFGCNLSALTIGANLTTIGTEALSCNFWNQITVSNDNTDLVFQNGALYAQNMTRVVAVLSTLDSVFTLPETVATIDDSVFLNVSGVQELQLNSSFTGFSSGAMGFNSCWSLESITVPGDNAALSSKDGVLFTADGKTLLTYPMAKRDTAYEIPAGTERIANYAIDNNINLRELVIPEGVTDLGYNFRYCQSLKKVTLPATVQTIRDKSIGYLYDSKVDGFIIRGVPGSAAETYATANGFTFQDSAEPDEPLPPSGNCGDSLTWTLKDGTLTISGTGAMWDFEGDTPWAEEKSNIQRVVLEEGITSIGKNAFSGIWPSEDKSLRLPDSLERLEEYAFDGCGFTALTVGSGLTAIAQNALTYNAWKQISVSEGNTAFVCQEGVLYSADMTRLVLIPKGYGADHDGVFTLPENVTAIDESAFGNINDIRVLKLNALFPGFQTAGPHFDENAILEEFVVPEDNTAICSKDGVLFSKGGETLLEYPVAKKDSVYKIPAGTTALQDSAICGNPNLTELVVPDGFEAWTGGVEACGNLKKVTLPASVKSIAGGTLGYLYDEKVEDFTICGAPGSVAETYAKDNGFTFESISQEPDSGKNYCGDSLTWTLEDGTLTISGTGAMTDYDRSNKAPWQGQTIESLVLNEGITSIGAHAFEFVNLQDQGTLQLPSSLQSIGEYAFFGCDLSELTIGPNLTTIGTEALTSNFWSQITVSDDNTALAFQNGALYAQNMTRVVAVLSALDSVFTLPETVVTIDDCVFLNVSGVQTLKLNSSFTGFSSGAIGFSVCPSLESITVPGDNAALSSKDGVLFTADGKTLLTYPMAKQDTAYEIPAGTERIANYAIDNNFNLRALVIPEGVTDLGEWNFRYCQALKKVTLPSTVQTIRDKSIGYLYDSKVDGFIIRGVPGSAAETYAEESGIKFMSVTQTSFTVHYDANGGQNAPDDQQGTLGTVLTLSGQVPTKPGYSFLGWDNSASAALPKYKAGDPYAEDVDTTLYAVWAQGDITNSGICGDHLVWYLDKEGTLTISGTGEMDDIRSTNSDGSSSEPWANLDFRKVVFGEGVTYISQVAFGNCTQLRELAPLPSTLKRIGYTAFFGCTNLTGQLVLPEGLEVVQNFAFYNTGISGVLVLPDSLRQIGAFAFASCENLFTIYVGGNVQSIGAYGFGESNENVRILYAGSQEQWESIAAEAELGDKMTVHFNAAKPIASESGQCGDNLTWTYKNGTLTISGVGVMADYTEASPAPWDSYGMEICTVVVEAGCTAIGSRAFWDCARMTTLSLPEGLNTIGAGATLGCDSLTTVLYAGSKTQFNQIAVGENNEAFRNAKLQLGNPTYRITYNNIGIDDTNPNPGVGTAEQDVTLAAAQRRGYTFGGWYADEALTKRVTKLSKTNREDVELWAKWTPNSFTIEFKGNAAGVTGTTAKVKGVTGVPITMPESTFQRKGYSFMYWTADSAGQGVTYIAGKELTFTVEKDGRVLTAYAQWMANRYTLELDPNGGDGDMDSVDACYDESLILPESEFQRIGYVFTGWNTKADGKGTAYKAGASVKNLAAEGSVTLYAQWKPNTYAVKFNANGGTGSMKNQTLTYGKAAALTANAFKRTGYVFNGWQDGEGNTYANKQSVTSLTPEGTVELTAQWTPITYTVKFKANGGQGEMDDVVLTYDEETEQPALGFAREGYRFLGWATSASGTVVYTPDEPLENLSAKAGATVTLYAKWTPYSYTVVYDGNGATGGSTKNQTMLCGKTYTLTKNGYTRTGYSFQGWSTIADTRVPEYTNSQKGVALSDTDMDVVILYAVWLPVDYIMTYKNVTYSEAAILAQTYNIETKGEAIAPGARPGCEFAGWYLDAKLTKEFTGFVPGTRTGNLTLYAKWNGDATHYVIRFAPGAEGVTGNMPDMTKLVSGKDYTLTKNAYKRTGYTFVGWALDVGMMEDRAVISDMPAYVPGYVENDPIVLTAIWKPTVCKLTYKNVTAQEQEGLPTTYDIEHPAALPELSREGYDFGWYTDSGLKKALTDNTVTGTGAKTIYAKWTAHKYLITFVANNGTSGTMQDISMTYGVSKALAANKYTRTGYTFLGWSTDPEDTVPMYKNQAKVLNLTADSNGVVTLFAIWKPTEYTLTYKNVTRDEASGLPTSYNIETEGTVPNASGRPASNFVGWYLDSKLTKPFTGFVPGTLPKNLTLYAAWNGPTIHYNIHFAPGAEGVTGKMADKTNLVCGKDYPLTKNGFKRTGYTFTGWTLYNASWKDGAVVSNLPIYVPSFYDGETFTLTAQWTPTSCKLTYKNVTAQELEELPAAYDIENPAVLPQLTREGYDFGGWFTDSSFKKPVADNTVSGTGNRTLYAKWTAYKYTVAFDGNGGSAAKGMKPMTATYGTAKALTANAFSRPGYSFLGWSEDPNATQATYKNQAKVLNLTSENGETVTLYAVWKAK